MSTNRVFKNVQELNSAISGPKGIVIGNFDGVHLAHKNLIHKFLETCSSMDLIPVLITLHPHPHVYFSGTDCASLLNLRYEKIEKLNELGIENLLEIEFTEAVQSLDAKDFILNFLFRIEPLKHITLGHDFALGNGKEDSRDILYSLASDDIVISELDSFRVDNIVCSSTRIRKALKAGDINIANLLLGDRFRLSGSVEKGSGNGKAHLVPTANIKVDPCLLVPAPGVYFTNTVFDGEVYKSITNIGRKPTIENNLELTIETHLIDLDQDLYGKALTVEFLEKCRDEKKFESLNALKVEILKNIEERKVFHD